MTITYDYNGNLWFVTDSFYLNPDSNGNGMFGYISRKAIEDTINGENVGLINEFHVYETKKGEGAENGLSSSSEGIVILTNLNCYLATASDDGVEISWTVPYENTPQKKYDTSGDGLSWSSGTTPSLTNDYVFFTDNSDRINMYCIDIKTGEIVDKLEIFQELDESIPMAVDNGILVYENENGNVSTITGNFYGAASVEEPDNSTIQSYNNLFSTEWLINGNEEIIPGLERIDLKTLKHN